MSTTTKTTRRAIYLPDTGIPEIITQSASYTPTGSQVLIRVRYSAVNPADRRIFHIGSHSSVAGYEWLGPVEAAGPESPYGVGELLFGLTAFGLRRPIETGAHQDFIVADTGAGSCTNIVPDNVKGDEDVLRQLVGWPSALRTAADALFNMFGFAFKPAGGEIEGVDPTGHPILIWGGSSAVGVAVIHLAAAAGFSPIYTTASPKNHAALLALGATRCFDYRSPTVVDDIRATVASAPGGKKLTTVFDAVSAGAEPEIAEGDRDWARASSALAARCLSDGVDERDVRLSSTLPLPVDARWKLCFCRRAPGESAEMTEYFRRIEATMVWALDQLASTGGGFRLPNVRVVEGAEAGLKAIDDVFEGKVSMEKYVIQHPL
ncbi:hypothetical protein F4825DRAFT_471994 [Nemania diffusa]|nr:hypothetical protein F4825DRAFT_471994 [Nemania diffusa]